MKNWSVVVMISLVAVVALLPFGRLSELPILLLAVIGLGFLVTQRQSIFSAAWFKPFTICYLAYFLLTSISAIDSYWPEKSWLISLGSVRFYLMGLAVIHCLRPKETQQVALVVGLLMLFWCLDALLQAVLGQNIIGLASYPGRLTGMFGDNAKLGPVLALFLAVVMVQMSQFHAVIRWTSVALVVLVVLLSGTRSAWLMLLFVLVMFWWQHVKGRRWLLLVKTMALMVIGLTVLWFASDDFQDRLDRSMQAFKGDQAALDFALADRLPIWQTAINMYVAHPINGVGARAFRTVYATHAGEGDVWVAQQGGGLHAHHWVLELLAETGSIGLLLMLLLMTVVVKHVYQVFRQVTVWPYGVALMAAMLPVVSLYSLFSSFWSICLWWLLVMLFAGVKNESN